MDEIFIHDLNEQQQQAITRLDGPVLVIAGAGSGKTKTLTYRIAYLMKEKQIDPGNIIAVTFTNKAANEMKERVVKLVGDSRMPLIGTFHSLCVRFLRQDGSNIGIPKNFTIYDTNDSIEAVKAAMVRLNISPKEYSPYKILGLISSCKSELISPDGYAQFARMPIQEVCAQVYPVYQSILREAAALDFDDLIMRTVELFTYKEVLYTYQERFKYILVDEYQDTNKAQYMLIKLLANKYKNIFCVGDPDQNIYTFRGATIDNILNFENDYPNCIVIMLEQNYRSTKNILAASHHVISKNSKRKEKEMWTENFEGEKIKRYIANSEKDEAYFIANKVKQLGDYSKYVVLYRTNAQSRAIEEIFLEEKVPYRLVGGLKFYDRKEIKDIISYLKLINNLKDSISLKRILNVPPRKIGKKTEEDMERGAKTARLSLMEYLLVEKAKQNASVQSFVSLIEYFLSLITMDEVTLSHFISIIIDRINYIPYLEQEEEVGKSRVENIKELNSVASRYDQLNLAEALEEFLENVSLVEQESSVTTDESNAVTLMSAHSAKGLEFDTVFVVGMEEGLFPHSNSMYSPDELEEERRLCYVAMTRAKRVLYLINAESRVLYGSVQANSVSRFIRDIPDYLISNEEKYSGYSVSSFADQYYDDEASYTNPFKKGDHVSHPVFSRGVVLEAKGDSVTINFDGYGKKKLLLAFARGLRKIQY